MKPMRKDVFISVITSLLERGIKPTFDFTPGHHIGRMEWTDRGVYKTEVLFNSITATDAKSDYHRARFTSWYALAVAAYESRCADDLDIGSQVQYDGKIRTVTGFRNNVLRSSNGTPREYKHTGLIILDHTIEVMASEVIRITYVDEAPIQPASIKPLSIRLVRMANCKYDKDELEAHRSRGKDVYMNMHVANYEGQEDRVERELGAMETMLGEKGWKSDNYPAYYEGDSCGFWVAPNELEQFRIDYMEVKAKLAEYLATNIKNEGIASDSAIKEPEDILPLGDENGEITLDVETMISNKQKYPMEFAVIGKHVFVGAIRTNNKYDKNYYIGTNLKETHKGREVFMKVPDLDADFFKRHAAFFDMQPQREIVILPDVDYTAIGGKKALQRDILGDEGR